MSAQKRVKAWSVRSKQGNGTAAAYVTYCTSPRAKARLKARARKEGTTMSAVVRRLVDAYLSEGEEA